MRISLPLCGSLLLAACSITRYYKAADLRGKVAQHHRQLDRAHDQIESNFTEKSELVRANCPAAKLGAECVRLRENQNQLRNLREAFLAEYAKATAADDAFINKLRFKDKIRATDPEWRSVQIFEQHELATRALQQYANDFAAVSNGMNKDLATVVPAQLDLVNALAVAKREQQKASAWIRSSDQQVRNARKQASAAKFASLLGEVDRTLAHMHDDDAKISQLTSDLRSRIGEKKKFIIAANSKEYESVTELHRLFKELENDSQRLETLTNPPSK